MEGKQISQSVEELHQLEITIINKIGEIGDDKLMDLFLDWQKKRAECNEAWVLGWKI